MQVTRAFGWIACVLLLCSTVHAGTATVSQTLFFTSNVWNEIEGGVWFMEPDVILDHPPFYRGTDEDWGWTHDITGLAPADATGIASATLTIRNWEVNVDDPDGAEVDVVSANGTDMGTLAGTNGREWGNSYLALPAGTLTDLWNESQVYIFLDIDTVNYWPPTSHRVALGYSTLTVHFTVPNTTPQPNMPIYRFYSEDLQSHFYTVSESEKDKLINNYSDVWTYEQEAYYTYPDKRLVDLQPVYRFWSSRKGAHFYTIDEGEKDKLFDSYGSTWRFEGTAFHAYSEGLQPAGTKPVYRFWSDTLGHHFYTMDEAEKQKLIDQYAHRWTFEGVAWYAYE